jgi:broad specificity phosphatase PhoE
MTRPSPQIDVHLVRHGETRSYFADVGLTARGVSQSRERGLRLVGELADGERVRVLWAPTARARETAEHLRGACARGWRARAVP